MKVLSPVIFNVKEADSFHLLEGSMIGLVMVRIQLLFRGLSPWHGAERMLQELGRPYQFHRPDGEEPAVYDSQQTLKSGEMVGCNNRKGRKSEDC